MAALIWIVCSQPESADVITLSMSWKVITFYSLSCILWFLIPIPQTLCKSSTAVFNKWPDKVIKPQAQHDKKLYPSHCSTQARFFWWCSLLRLLSSPKPKCTYYSRLNASDTTGINRKPFLCFDECKTRHLLCSDASENYRCAEVRNSRWESAYTSRKFITDNLEKVNSRGVLGNLEIWMVKEERNFYPSGLY